MHTSPAHDAPTTSLMVGSSIRSWRIRALAGRGGTGSVFSVEHQDLKLRRALKVLDQARTLDASARERFVREGRALSKVRHPNVVEVFDVGVEGDVLWLVLEQLEGSDLASLLRDKKRVAADEALEIFLPIIAALAAVHDAGITHRDVTPSNIFVARDAAGAMRPVLLDFGVCSLDERSPVITQASAILGTPAYMAPEQIRTPSKAAAPSDQFSVAVCLFEALSGSALFTRATVTETLAAVLDWNPAQSNQLAEVDSPVLRAAIRRALDPIAARRFSSALELGDALASHSRAGADRWRLLTGRSPQKRRAHRGPAAAVAFAASAMLVANARSASHHAPPTLSQPSTQPAEQGSPMEPPALTAAPTTAVTGVRSDTVTPTPAALPSTARPRRAVVSRPSRAADAVADTQPILQPETSPERVVGRGANGALIIRHAP